MRFQHGGLPADLRGEFQLGTGIGDHVVTQFCEPVHFADYGKAKAFAAIVHRDDHRRHKLVGQPLGPDGVDGKETADGDQQGSEAAQLVLLLRGQATAQVTEMGDAVLTVAQDADGVGAALGAVFVIVPGFNGLRRKRGGGTLTQGYTLGPAVIAVTVAAQDLVGLDTDWRKPRHTAILVWIQHNSVTL